MLICIMCPFNAPCGSCVSSVCVGVSVFAHLRTNPGFLSASHSYRHRPLAASDGVGLVLLSHL